MSHKARVLCMGLMAAVGLAAALILPTLLQGSPKVPAANAHPLVMHEWGTFTSFVGTDSVEVEFRPRIASDLPRFVMTASRQPEVPVSLFLKDIYVARQRMETPVTYFYTDVERTIHARVEFPKGALTEWYPVVAKYANGAPTSDRPMGGAFLDWGEVRLIPPSAFSQVRVRDDAGKSIRATLPAVGERDHYGRARETDSAIVETVDVNKGSHFEKFLFYRGLGDFDLPIKLTALGSERFKIANEGNTPSSACLLMRIENGSVRFARVDSIGAQASTEITLPKTVSIEQEVADATVRELIAAGLYEKESRAMVNTWRASWFAEDGTRLLYLVPTTTTDELLPLSVEPTPQERVRVLVGRIETITPEDCQRLLDAFAAAPLEQSPEEMLGLAELKKLGRFVEPALKFVIAHTTDVALCERMKATLTTVRREFPQP